MEGQWWGFLKLVGKEEEEKVVRREGDEGNLLLKSPSCAAGGIGWSRRFDAGFCAAGIEIRSCRFGIGRFCCHHGRRVCPAQIDQINDIFFVGVEENLTGDIQSGGTTDCLHKLMGRENGVQNVLCLGRSYPH